MKISELSRRGGRSIPAIKFYLREGLLPPGRRTATNQADYDDGHLRRLRLIGTLIDIGGLPVAAVRQVLAALDDDRTSLHDVVGIAHHALAMRTTPAARAADEATTAEVNQFLAEQGWRIKPDAPARRELADTLMALRSLGWRVDAEVFEPYARAADELAAWELEHTPPGPRSAALESVVIGTVVFETALVALRRLAEEHHSWRRFARRRRRPSGG